jgi:MOSC domain-containing protein
MVMNVSAINVYPIKSLRGTALEKALVCSYGLEHDRRWMLVDPASKMITQRECPLVATLTPGVDSDGLRIATPDGREVFVPYDATSWTDREVTVDVWGHAYVGVAAVSEINGALSEVIGMPCQLLSIRADVFRTKRDVAFHDDSPILVISESSLEELNRQLAFPLPMDRFRPNIVVRDAAPFDEDGWQRIAIGDAAFRAVKDCLRCVTTTIDQATGTPSGPEPLATLAKFRRKGEGVAFGQYYRPEQAAATIRLGDAVTVLGANYSQAARPSG